MEHIIQKQIMTLSVPSFKIGSEWQDKLQPWLQDVINPAIEEYFDQIATKEESMVIEHLEINIGSINDLNKQEIKEKIFYQLRNQFKSGKTNSTETKDPNTREKSILQKLNPDQTILVCFLCFIVTGELPWWSPSLSADTFNGWIHSLSKEQAAQIQKTLKENQSSLNRIVYQFTPEFLSTLLKYYLPSSYKAINDCWKWISKAYSTQHDSGLLYLTYWKYWVALAIDIPSHSYEVEFLNAMGNWITSTPEVKPDILSFFLNFNPKKSQQELESNKISPQEIHDFELRKQILIAVWHNDKKLNQWLYKQLQSQAHKGLPRLWDDIMFSLGKTSNVLKDEIARKVNLQERESDQNQQPLNLLEIDKPQDSLSKLNLTKEEARYIKAAGLVLIHPFLVELFKTLNLWNGKQWRSDLSQHQAVGLLTWMAFGKINIPEYELVIPKLLCAMPLEEPLNAHVGLSEDCMNSATELLQAVIQHWKAIGNTSIDGLREGFILRNGRVTQKNNDWQITVESKTQDILMKRLPWGISLIHFPWLENRKIFVEWI